ncbi:hypothetical protein LUZ60_013495 [Juncus effusus]|nr:hypothetical protein LUZ60_013495 [Juncus effusus]
MASSAPKPIWVRQAEEAKLKSDAATAAAAKAAFEATFNATANPESALLLKADNSESESDGESRPSSPAAIGPVDPRNCIVAGPGVAGGASGSPVSFTLTLKDSNGNKIPQGGAVVKAKISPGPGVGGPDIEAMVKDSNDGTYTITYLVPKRGNYNVHLSVSDSPITGSPFPVFFSTGSATPAPTTATPTALQVPMYGMINQTMPNMPNYMVGTGLGMMATGNSGGVILQGAGASLGEVCKEYLHGKCNKKAGECKFGHPPQALLMQVLATAATSMNGALMGPSAAAMAAAQAIVAAQALQAHHASQMKDSTDPSGSPDKAATAETLKRTVQISNLNPLLTTDQLKQLFGLCGAVTDCTITDSKHFAYIEFTKPESAASALSLNNIEVGGRPLNVEMAKSLPVKSANNASLPTMMQQAVALQQMQFQQALAMQQAAATQAAAARAATMKSATEAAAARAREISMKLKAEAGLPVNGSNEVGETAGNVEKEKEEKKKERSLSPLKRKSRSRSRSRSPIKYRSSRRRSRSRSKSYSPPVRRRRSRSPVRSSRYSSSYRDRRERDEYGYRERRERERRERDRRDGERRDSERRESEKRERDKREGERGEGERRESEKTRDHHSSSSRRERERRESERSRSRERKYGKYEKDETKRGVRDEDEKRNHDRVSSQKDPKPDKKEKVVEEERDSDTGDERETLPSDLKSHKRKSDRDDYDKGHSNKDREYSRGEKTDKRKLDKKENLMEEERESKIGEERERETIPSSDSKSRKRKMDRDEYGDDGDYDKRQHRRSHRSEKTKEDYYHEKKSERKSHRDASKTVPDSKSERWMDEELLDD